MLVAAGLTSGCGGFDVPVFDPNTQARLRIVHASSATSGEAEFFIEEARVARLLYAETTAYLDVAAGGRTVTMRGLPDQAGNQGATFIRAPVTLSAGRYHTVVITGSGDDVSAIPTTDGASPPSGSWSLRIVHAAQRTPSLDLYVTEPGSDLNAAIPLVQGISWRDATAYQVIATTTLQINLTLTGTKNTLISSDNIAFQDQQVSTLFVIDNLTLGGRPFALFLGDGEGL